jgi:protein SERAC1
MTLPPDGQVRAAVKPKGSAPTLRLYKISDATPGPKTSHIVFVHGLTGSATDTWGAVTDGSRFWPKWLADDLPFADVWILDYPADLFWWAASGANMALPDRARSVIDYIVNNGVGRRPLTFVTHSLGGLLVKAMLRGAQSFSNKNWKHLLGNMRGIAFLGTPHSGASLGTLARALSALGITHNATQLRSNEPHLRELSAWYSQNAEALGIRTLAYYEMGTVLGVKVVASRRRRQSY